jgi:2-phosphosulfolactate phosphatase
MLFDQSRFDIRFDWGSQAVEHLGPISDAIIIVDALSFTTTVSVAVKRGAVIYPFPHRNEFLQEFARSVGALVAGHRSEGGYSLSPASVKSIPPGTKLVLPSPNGGTLSLLTGNKPTLAGCFRNSRAVAEKSGQYGNKIAVIASGEKWSEDGSLRPALEDFLGAGAIISHLRGSISPEAASARASFWEMKSGLLSGLLNCASGKELTEMGYSEDVCLAAELDVDDCAPVLEGGAYRAV